MTDMPNVWVAKTHKDIKNDSKDQCTGGKVRRRLTLCTKRYSRKRVARRLKKQRLAALQKVSEASTSDGHKDTPENIIYLPFDEKAVQELKCENHENDNIKELSKVGTNNVDDWSNVQTNNTANCSRVEIVNEEFVAIKTENEEFSVEDTIIESDNQSCVLSMVDMQHIFSEFKTIGDHAKYKGDCGIRHLQIIGMKRLGLRTSISVICAMCLYTAEIHSAPDENNEVLRFHGQRVRSTLTGTSHRA